MIRVTIFECRYGQQISAHTAHTDCVDEAVQRVIRKAYGKGCYFCRENEISVGADALEGSQYGQIGRKCRTGGTSLVTGRVRISADRVNRPR